MFERYTERARRVLFFARYEASEFGSLSIETEHLLLGLIRDGRGLTMRCLGRFGATRDGIRQEIETCLVRREKVSTSVEIPFSDEARRVLQYAAEESDRLRHNHIGTEHLLLGILREERSKAGSILMKHGMRLDAVREDLVRLKNEQPQMEMEVDPLRQLVEENARLRALIRHLETERQLPLQFRDNAYWVQLEWQPSGPYCSTCWDVDRRLVRKLTADDGALYCEYCTHHRPRS